MTPAVDPKAFGQLVAYHREQRGVSQGALAKAAGISRPYLSQVESGKRLPSDEPESLWRPLSTRYVRR
jgi:transcriptional regulator with XRE-family HTH domain